MTDPQCTDRVSIRRDCPQYTAEEMMQRWFRNLQPVKRPGVGTVAWGIVSEVFAVGSTVAIDQCLKFGQDPEAYVRRKRR